MDTITGSPTRVFLVDDHDLVREAVADLVTSTGGLEFVGEAATTAQALSGIRSTTPDVVVLDLQLPDGNGIDACYQLRTSNPDIRCLILTAHGTDYVIDAAARAGAAGLVVKNIRGFGLIDAIRDVAAGRSLFAPGTAGTRSSPDAGQAPGA
ncbi:Transcriptional regulatory protein DevR (DosR) [Microbacterium sp. Bi98]|uniref:response regulator n=1 Tax=Microbacterium sp. Bi98 TaxID=2821116 RepID=UPI001D9332CF|nr:response regulator transcription factor [Microbacterium sp. Bi98]CAH0150407.1 Transcriptional regulatory protein DevR (DosR) [Microbacterium sp. Bi98]